MTVFTWISYLVAGLIVWTRVPYSFLCIERILFYVNKTNRGKAMEKIFQLFTCEGCLSLENQHLKSYSLIEAKYRSLTS